MNETNKNYNICTIISKNYLAQARVLTESFLKYHHGNVFVLLVDTVDGYFDPGQERFQLVEIASLKEKIKNYDEFCFQYNIAELNTAVKPFFLEFLFEKYSIDKIVYFDPDILITDCLDALFDLLDKYAVLLIPHITKPYADGKKPSETDILKSGVYNLGFLALSRKPSAEQLLRWWKERLGVYCKVNIADGLFVDQKWIDLIPGFFEDVHIVHDERYNIAYWNLHYSRLSVENDRVLVNGRPAYFVHFSGFNPNIPDSVSLHQDRFSMEDLGVGKIIFQTYKDLLLKYGFAQSLEWPWYFDRFDNGVKIPAVVRDIFWELRQKTPGRFGNPFEASQVDSFFQWLNESFNLDFPGITRLMFQIHQMRPDVQGEYRNIFGADYQRFLSWILCYGKREHRLDPAFLPDIKHICREKLQNVVQKPFYKKDLMLKKIYTIFKTFRMRMTEMALGFSEAPQKNNERGPRPQNQKIINVIGYLTAELGVGQGARSNIKCLHHIGIDPSLINITSHSVSRKNDSTFSNFRTTNPGIINLMHINADMIPLLRKELGESFFKSKYNIGYWVWELSNFPEIWSDSFRYCQEIWTPSRFAKDAIAKSTSIPVRVIPHAVHVDIPDPMPRSHFGLPENDFIFLFIFDLLSIFERKNPLAIIEAFRKSFSPSENATLVLKCINAQHNPDAIALCKDTARGLRIRFMEDYLSRHEVNALMALCDSYISLHRSEGFGLTLAETMFLGKPVIATGYSGNCDFMSANNSYLVKYKLAELAQDYGPYRKGNVWAEPDIDDAAKWMRNVYENKTLADEIGRVGAQEIRQKLSYEAIGQLLKKRVESILFELYNAGSVKS